MAKETYKNTLLDVTRLKGEGMENLHRRVTLLNSVFEDAEFRRDYPGDDHRMAEALSSYVNDVCLSFLHLRAILRVFPNVADWTATKSISELYDRAFELSRPKVEEKPKRSRETITLAEHKKTLSENKDLAFKVKQFATERSELKAREELAKTQAKQQEKIAAEAESKAASAISKAESMSEAYERVKAENDQLKSEVKRLESLVERKDAEILRLKSQLNSKSSRAVRKKECLTT